MSENAAPQDKAELVIEATTAAISSSKDKRTIELEQLRKKQLARSWQETNGDNGKTTCRLI